MQLAKTQDGVTIHRKATASSDINRLRGFYLSPPLYCDRATLERSPLMHHAAGQITINVAPEKVFEALVDSTHLKYVDQLYIGSKVCEQYDPEHAILHYQFKYVDAASTHAPDTSPHAHDTTRHAHSLHYEELTGFV
jgi:hypothetical protein